MVNLGFWVDFVLKTAKMKLPLHDLLIVKATAPFHHFAWLVAFTNSSQIISTHLLTVLTKRCNVILQIEQEQKGGCLYEYK